MKVYLGKPRYHWISPYTMLDYAFFWTDWSKRHRDKSLTSTLEDEARILRGEKSTWVDRPEWTDRWADRLTPISVAIQWILDRVRPEINYIKIDRWDSWSMDHTLSPIILPMLKQLQATKHGSPMVDDADVPEHLWSTAPGARDGCNEWDTDNNVHLRWEWVMDEMIWAFTQLTMDDHEQQFWDHSGVDYSQPLLKQMGKSKCDWDGLKAHNDRIANGTRLFGKYYQALWD